MPGDAARVHALRRQQAAIAAFGSFALRESNLLEVLAEAARVCADGLNVRFCKVCRYRPEENDLLIEAGFGWQPGVIGHVISRADASSPQGRAFTTGQPAICDDLRKENAFELPAFYATHGVISTIDVLIKGDDLPYGVLEVDSDVQHNYDQHDVDFVTAFANVVAEAVATSARTALLQRTVGHMQVLVHKLRKNEERFRTVVEAAPSALVMFNGDGRIEMVNTQTERIFGYGRADLLGQKVDMLVPERFRARYPAVRSDFFTEPLFPPMRPGAILLGLHRDGHEFPIEIGLTSIRSNGDDLTLSTISDISERTLLEAQLRQAQKMEAVGRLTAGIAHDFNNLLQAMTGSLELILEDVTDRPETLEYGQIALRAARRGGELTHRLLAFSRQQLLLPRALPARHMVSEVANLITSTFGPNISLTILPIPDDLAIMADAAQLEAAILNLAMNARDAMGGSGRITMEAYRDNPGAEMALASGDYIVIAIEDTGTGMDEATLAQACEPFFTTKGVDGSGLGLSMVQGFARQSGGDLHIVSAPGRGTRVEIWLPPLVQPENEGAEPIAEVPKIVRGRVLLVDDEADVLVTVGAFLRNAGYVVTGVTTGAQALEMLLAGNQFDAIVTDYALPGSNGIDILRQACEIDKTLPGLIITGYYNAGLRDAVDGSLILRKPFSRAKLIERVEALVASRRELAAKSSDGAG